MCPCPFSRAQRKTISSYTTALLRNGDLAGSGTWVKVGKRYGVLTAHHVAYRCSPPFDFSPGSSDRLGLGVASGIPHDFYIEMQHLIPHEIGVHACDEWGPDLLFLEIPKFESRLQTILAKRQFWDLSSQPDERIARCMTETGCVWATAGHPYELVQERKPSHGFSTVFGSGAIAGLTMVERRHRKDDFDYLDVFVDYRSNGAIPKSCEGESGGGLWLVPVSKEKASDPWDKMIAGEPILAGVMFYQGPVENDRRFLRSHGPESIYKVMREKLDR
jgi:hypothetical protein